MGDETDEALAIFLESNSTARADGAWWLHDGTPWFKDPDVQAEWEAFRKAY